MNRQANPRPLPDEPEVSSETEPSASAALAEPLGPCAANQPACLADGRPLFLVGMMGAGKTTIGRGLARILGREFVDLDHQLEARCGVRVPVIFEIEGEAGFRRREAQALCECTQRRGIVLATGGGAILDPENRRLLHERGLVVYLRASLEELFRRTSRDRNRPLLATEDPRGTLRQLMTARDPLYAEAAHLVVDTGTCSVNIVVKQLLSRLYNTEIAS
ncbi:MAG TPA: shikimate kinase [Bordetella sp.]